MASAPSGDGLRRRAFQLRDTVSADAAAYAVLAEALDCPLVTRDERSRERAPNSSTSKCLSSVPPRVPREAAYRQHEADRRPERDDEQRLAVVGEAMAGDHR